MEQNRCISLLGSTGSIGRQSLDVIAACGMRVAALTANRDVEQMEKQCRRFQPELAVMMDPEAAASLRLRLADTPIRVAEGMEGLLEAASLETADTVLTAVVGIVGLRPTLAAIRAGKRIALANKETLVCAGELVSDAAAWSGSQVVPVDSEHSAIFQCLQGCQDRGEVRRLILTASGGPFWGWKGEDLAGVTVEQALAHPNWNMGAKISVDSATMMNKGLEFIEAMRLYHMPPEKISIVIHRESIVHSLVEYCDHAVLAQLGVANAKGLSQRAVMVGHAFRNSLVPIITLIGNYFGGILGGSTIIENIFAIPGLGSYVLSAIQNRDYPVIQGYVLITGTTFVLVTLAIDLLYIAVNPKIRLQGGEA